MTEREETQPAESEEAAGSSRVATARANPGAPPAVLRPEQFSLPPRPQMLKSTTRFGRFVKMLFVVFVLVPTVLTILFYGFVAADQYATESAFSVRGASATTSSIDIGAMFGVGGTGGDSETADSYILQDYIESREMVEHLVAEANFLEIYSRPSADPYYRLDPETTIEGLVSYWQTMSAVEYDTDTGIISMTIRAFRPADAEAITKKVLEKSEDLINFLSLRAREDSLQTARNELKISEKRYSDARKKVASYRGSEREIDPTAVAASRQSLVGSLEAELSSTEAELSALLSTMSKNSPRVVYVQNKIDSLQRQIAKERLSVAVRDAGSSDGPDQLVLTERLSNYEEIVAEREFAERAYVSSLASLESARVDAMKQQRYLAVFLSGSAPEDATYPQAIRWTAIVFGSLFLIWGMIALVGAAIRDRVS
ncbi:hypothetical protein RDV64_03075 [Acuticoccus sp. MNP-M23]|uniref:hypothetical protein n=1 Tax=Acuticoccus sp. MNP-M23 TaxID=3072793 RepID=UPI00281664E4|nr:hypothetical protein [Acuticoccus sp. MNP-M23]WMS43402.1 hypothetical protein RDV64_03075 [Acuticoccus sp. MNP-M23]